MTPKQILALKMAGQAILSTIEEASKDGPVPEGILYAACQAQGATLNQFQQIMSGMESSGLISRGVDHLVEITDKGKAAAVRFAEEISILKAKLGVCSSAVAA